VLEVSPLVVPLLGAVLLAAFSSKLSRAVGDVVAVACSAATTVACGWLMSRALHAPSIVWLGGHLPRSGTAVGIALAIEPLGVAFALLTAVLALFGLVFAVRYFEAEGVRFHAIYLTFVGAMCGFGIAVDLFDMFVLFELMSVAAFALCAFKTKEPAPLQGALNFAVTNSIAAVLVLLGLSLMYARTGALNLAQIGRSMGASDPLVVAAFTCVACGFLVKAAILPFHFWLADAHAVAPTPVCVLFSGIMVQAGVHAVARIYAIAFAPSFAPHLHGVRIVLVAFAIATCVVGAAMCLAQRHLKRMLAFSTVAHVGVVALGLASVSARGFAGAAVYVVGHGLVKGALFMCAGLLLHGLESVDELALYGRGRAMKSTMALMFVGGLALAGAPPFAHALGEGWIGEAAVIAPAKWASILVAVVTGGAVLRAAIRISFGLGPRKPDAPEVGGESSEDPETETRGEGTPLSMIVPAFVLLAAALVLGIERGWTRIADASARELLRPDAFAAFVLDGARLDLGGAEAAHFAPEHLLQSFAQVAAALGLAALLLAREHLPRALTRAIAALWNPLMRGLRTLHSGAIGDYAAWLVAGVACFGVALAFVAS
jgi:multicomponent Na+:H+ antiporter subunit D